MEHAPHLAILPSPGMGHFIPHTELAKRLVHNHGCSVTIIIPTSGNPSKAMADILETLPKTINHIFLPPVSLVDLPKDVSVETQISLTVVRSLPSLRETLKSLIALLVDPLGFEALDVARELKVSPYLFSQGNAMLLSLCFYLPRLDEMVSCEFRDFSEPINIPGCVPVHGRDLPDPFHDRSDVSYKWLLQSTKNFSTVEGILVNSFMELEEGATKALQVEEPGKPPIYPVGPLIQTSSSSTRSEQPECLQWLDNQPSGSVLFVSFGSGGTLSHDQLNELAMGLEMSGQRFLWVVRSPNNNFSNAAYLDVQIENDHFCCLPKGFLDRTKAQGLVVPSWAPQVKVLSHTSTGGFLTHCGWNSTLESIVHGVPLIAWPLHAEQKLNAVMLTKGCNIALRPKVDEKGLVVRDEIKIVVKDLMQGEEGKKIGNRMKELKDVAMKVLSEDGSSTKALTKLAVKWKNQKSIS